MKNLTIRQFAAVKRNAQNVSSLVVKKNKLINKIEDLTTELNNTITQIDAYEAGTKAITEGYTSEQLVDRIVEGTGKQDANGHEIKITKYVPKEGVVIYDEANKVYIIAEADDLTMSEDSTKGADLDVDADKVNIDMVEDNTFDPTSVAENGFEN